jgi:hypothetical protein
VCANDQDLCREITGWQEVPARARACGPAASGIDQVASAGGLELRHRSQVTLARGCKRGFEISPAAQRIDPPVPVHPGDTEETASGASERVGRKLQLANPGQRTRHVIETFAVGKLIADELEPCCPGHLAIAAHYAFERGPERQPQ